MFWNRNSVRRYFQKSGIAKLVRSFGYFGTHNLQTQYFQQGRGQVLDSRNLIWIYPTSLDSLQLQRKDGKPASLVKDGKEQPSHCLTNQTKKNGQSSSSPRWTRIAMLIQSQQNTPSLVRSSSDTYKRLTLKTPNMRVQTKGFGKTSDS